MGPRTPEEICTLFQRHMRDGDIDGVLSVYDREVAFVRRSGDVVAGKDALRAELMPFVSARASFDFEIHRVARAGDIALMHTAWTIAVLGQAPTHTYALEVARLQADGTWRWLIGDPFTVGQHVGAAK